MAFRLKWDVFLNFRGEDTRHRFTIPLRDKLGENGVRAFFDDEGLRQGDSLDPVLYEAIQDSSASITIISPKYASSRWCLEELAMICECRRFVLPVFYWVEPSDVRRQSGPFEGDFRKLEEKFGVEMVGRWRNAMEFIGKLKGRVFNESDDAAQLIQLLVNDIMSELNNTPQYVAPYTVGLDFPMKQLLKLLNPRSNNPQVVLGLHGMGGVGKTTLAKALFNKLVSHFEHRIFISNIRDASSKQDGLVYLKNKLFQDLCPGGMAANIDPNNTKIKDRLPKKPVFVVLDDVDNETQLNALVEKREWFYEGSRIIITTRDRHVFSPHLVNEIYEVKELGFDDSLRLFRYHAFGMEKPMLKLDAKFLSLSNTIVSITGRLPLALEVFGSFLFDKRSVERWEDVLKQFRGIRPGDLQEVLKISYDGLGVQEKRVFLDIACLLLELEMNIDDAIDILEGCGFSAKSTVDILIQRSLVKVRENNELWMHDQIRDMGRQIVLDENLVATGMRSRLWDCNEILGVLEDRTGTGSIEGIILSSKKMKFPSNRIKTAKQIASNNIHRGILNWASIMTCLKEIYGEYIQGSTDQEEGEIVLQTEPFQSMNNLRLLHLSGVKLEGDFEHLPAKLKWLQWKNCPLKNLPSATHRELAVLDLSESKIETLWGSRWWYRYNCKVAKNLRILNLYGCHNIRWIPDLSGLTALKKLNLELCKNLARIHKSIGDLTSLQILNLKDCSSLVEFPQNVSGLKNLETLSLSGCLQLKELPEDMKRMSSLKELLIDWTAITKLPDSIIRLTKLKKLHARGCKSLSRLPMGIGNLGSLRELFLNESALENVPNSIGSLKNLQELNLMWCTSLTAIPDSVCNLKSLMKFWINGSSVAEIPASIGSIRYLKVLSVANCSQIRVLPVPIGQLASMVELQLDGTSIRELPDEINGLKSLRMLEMRNCESLISLPETIGGLMALETLILENAAITELPESIVKLENLVFLNLNRCGKLCRLPNSIGELKSLRHLLMEKTVVSELPDSFGKLSNLMILKMGKNPWQEVPESNSKLPKLISLPSSFSDLSLLEEFDAKAFRISGKVPDEFNKLSSLEILNLGHNNFYSLPSSLKGLALLKELSLEHCKELKVLPPLPSSLVKVNAAYCIAMERITDLSNLKSLKELNLTNCEKLVQISGLECLESLIWLHMIGCNSCSSDLKEKLNKVSLKKLHGLSMPGRLVPNWFTPDLVSCSKPKNYVIKAVIIVVVVAVNHQIEDVLRDQLPVIPDVQATILRLGDPVFSTALYLAGVPKTDEDQVYVCRYPEYHPLVSILRDGDEIQVAMKTPPCVRGVELKKSGIHLVFENDDDFDGDEEWLDESNQSVSERLTNDIRSSEENGTQ